MVKASRQTLVLFDLGGVLADLGRPAKQMGLEVTDETFWKIWQASPAVEAYERGRLSTDSFLAAFAAEIGVREPSEVFAERIRRWRLQLFPQATALLHVLKPQVDLALLSNTNLMHWNMIREAEDIADLFDAVFLSFETGLLKPLGEAFENVVSRLGIAPAEILFLDDATRNVQAARRCGIQAVTVRGLDGARTALANAGIAVATGNPGNAL